MGRMIRLAEASSDDIEAVAGFFWSAWEMAGPDAPGWAGAAREVIEELTAPEVLAARIDGPQRRMFLAWDGDEVVGFAATRLTGADEAELAGIVVREDRTGEGIGGPLLKAACAAMEAGGIGRVTVETEADNERAIGFYRRYGFEIEGETVRDVEGTPIRLCALATRLRGR
jgi:ribosomal protein S18 acetylase RimI-like enzyme